MDFFEHQERARRKTGLLVVYFAVAVVLIIIAVYLAIAAVLLYGQSRGGGSSTLWFPDVFAAVSLGTLVLVSIGSLHKIAELSQGGEFVARSLGGRPLQSNTRNLSERVLLNVVEEMAIAAGTPVPPVYLLDKESAINAFAAGTSPQNAVIGVTRGTVETLSRDELQGVIAHEFSHILNGDMRLNIRLIGILNGILLIATIGYILMRTGSSSSGFSSSSSDKKGGNPLPLLGLLLYAIGYVGVFFGHLIKSAVSRQREFLADASAVQFTRLPEGIAGALMKIGGYSHHSRLRSDRAEEASHMYFGNGLAAPLFQLLATHPPLDERIRRIDPTFDGRYPNVEPIEYTAADLVEPSTLAARRQSLVHELAAAGAQTIATQPSAVVEQVGDPRSEHLGYAAKLVVSLPSGLQTEVRDPLGAIAAVYALLLADNDPEVRRRQLEYLAEHADPKATAEMQRLVPAVQRLEPQDKLPLVSMVVPPLHELSARQLAAFRDDVTFLIEADRQATLFEYGVQRLVLKRLLPRLERRQATRIQHERIEPLLPAAVTLLSTLAHSGSRTLEAAERAFRLGIEKLTQQGVATAISPREACEFRAIDAALDQWSSAAPRLKKAILEACATTIGADARVTVEEGELLRIIADALSCPMPPLLPAD